MDKINLKPKITVITPTYNRKDLIKETIDSVINQDFKDFEYLILDDGSTDDTYEIVKPYLKDKRIKYFYNKNSGEAETVNLGWNLANGEYFTQINSDDPILPGLFREMVKILEKKKDAVVVYPDFYFINEKGNIIQKNNNSNWNFLKALSNFSCNAAAAGTFIRKTAFNDWEKIKDKRFKYISDIDMYWKMALKGSFYHLPKFLANWRVHSGNISNERYKSIPEIEVWFREYYLQNNLSNDVLNCKEKTRKSIYSYCIALLEKSLLNDKHQKINYYKKKLGLPVFDFKNLQVGDNDLIGNKFNGHDLHKYLRERFIDSRSLVWNKESNDENTYLIAGEKSDRELTKQNALDIQKRYCLNSISNPISYDILYNELFLNTDIAHFHLIHNFIFDIQLLPIMSRLIPIVWTLHDPWSLGGHCIHHFDCEKWKSHCGDCSNINSHFILDKDNSALNFEIKKQAIENSKLDVIVASKWMKNIVEKSPIFKDKKIHLIPFGIDQSIFKPIDNIAVRKELNIPKNAFVITFRCDYSGFKGMDYIEYILQNIKTKKKIFLLLLAGDFNDKIKINFKYKSYGWVKDDYLLRDIYNSSDLFLAPSSADAFGLMAVEAMSCGVLPIVLDGTALPDTVNAPECGVAVKRDKEEYLQVVQYYIDHDKERNLRAKKCLEYARKNYNKDVYVNKIIKVYKEAIKNHKMTENDEYLLDQLKKHMMVDPVNSIVNLNEVNTGNMDKSINGIIKRVLSIQVKRKIKDYILIFFYKVDKLAPKEFRKKIKSRLIRYNLVRKYLIK